MLGEKDSIAIDVPGITNSSVEEARLRDTISDRLEPRIDRIAVRTIPLSNGGGVLVVEIPVCELNIYAVRVDKGRYEFRIRIDKKNAELSFSEIQYRLLADLDSLRFRRKAEAILKTEKISVNPIFPPSYNEFMLESVNSASIMLKKLSSEEIVTIPYELIQTIYYSHGSWIIYLLQGYRLTFDGKRWSVEQCR